MIGKVARMVIGRTLARRGGMGGPAGMAAGLLAPIVIKAVGRMLAKGGRKAADARRMRNPKHPPRY